MQKKCREAGAAILDLEAQVQAFKKDIDIGFNSSTNPKHSSFTDFTGPVISCDIKIPNFSVIFK